MHLAAFDAAHIQHIVNKAQLTRKPINRAYLTLVAVDGEGKPVMVPGLIIGSEAERAEWEAGMRRREIRKQRKEEGF